MTAVLLLVVTEVLAADPGDVLIFHVRGEDYTVTNPLIADIKALWTAEKAKVEQAWKNEVDSFRITIDLGLTTATLGAENTQVSLPELPELSLTQGGDKTTLDFSSAFTVNWTTRFCAPFGGFFRCDAIDTTESFSTRIVISGDRGQCGRLLGYCFP